MLALGVIVISHAGSFATDATAILFGDILAVAASDLVILAIAVVVVWRPPSPHTGHSSRWPSTSAWRGC